MDAQKENKTIVPIKTSLLLNRKVPPFVFSRPLAKPLPPPSTTTSDEPKPVTTDQMDEASVGAEDKSTVSNKPANVDAALFKTPLKPLQAAAKVNHHRSTTDLGNLKAMLHQEMATMDTQKVNLDPKSVSAKKPSSARTALLGTFSTPQSAKKATAAASSNLTSTFKFDPKCVTGIPWIKPKKTTVPTPFNFASDRLAAKRATTTNGTNPK